MGNLGLYILFNGISVIGTPFTDGTLLVDLPVYLVILTCTCTHPASALFAIPSACFGCTTALPLFQTVTIHANIFL